MAGVEPNSGKNPGNTIQCLSNSEGQAPNCSYCHKGRHFLTQCVEFLNGSLSDQPTSVRGVTHKMLKPTGWGILSSGRPEDCAIWSLRSFSFEEHGFDLGTVIIVDDVLCVQRGRSVFHNHGRKVLMNYIETALEGNGSGRMTDVSNYTLWPKSSVNVVENVSEWAPQKSEILRDETRGSSRSKVRVACVPEYQNVWCSQLKAREGDHFEWSLPESSKATLMDAVELAQRLRELSEETLGYVGQDIANAMLKWTPMEVLLGELLVDEEANVLVVSGPVGRDAEQAVPESLNISKAAYVMQKSAQFLGSGIFGEQICRSVMFNRLLLRATDLVLENDLCRRAEWLASFSQFEELSFRSIIFPDLMSEEVLGLLVEGVKPQLHVFVDVSSSGFVSAAYLRLALEDESFTSTKLVGERYRDVPKHFNIGTMTSKMMWSCTKLGLRAIYQGAELAIDICKTLGLSKDSVMIWSSSKAALRCLETKDCISMALTGQYCERIANLIPTDRIQWASGAENPANVAALLRSASEMFEFPMWTVGPSFLRKPRSFWPILKEFRDTTRLTFAEVTLCRSLEYLTDLQPEDDSESEVLVSAIKDGIKLLLESLTSPVNTNRETPDVPDLIDRGNSEANDLAQS